MSASRWRRNPNILFNKIDRDIVIFDDEKGAYYGMNTVGSHIWELLVEPKSTSQIVAQLLPKFEVSESECSRDVELFLKQMSDQKLIEVIS